MVDIFPPRNLPDRAQQWGRAMEGAIIADERALTQMSQIANNWDRFASGQLAVSARSLEEVVYRSTDSKTLSDISVTGSATAEPYPRVDTVVSFDPTPKDREALLVLSGSVSTNNPSVFTRMYVYLLLNGAVVGGDWAAPSVVTSTPSEWQNNAPLFVLAPVGLRDSETVQVTLRIVRAADAFSPGTSTLTLHSPILTLARSGAI